MDVLRAFMRIVQFSVTEQMFDTLPCELVAHIVESLCFDDICVCREVSRTWYALFYAQDWIVARQYARAVLEDEAFWELAAKRPKNTSKPCETWHREIVRMETFRRGHRLKATDFYEVWPLLDCQ